MDIREKMRRDWDRRARIDPRYWVAATEEADEASYASSAEKDAEALVEGLHGRVDARGRVLDLGCGIGRLAAPLAARFGEVVGVDVSPAMIETARELHGGLSNVRFEANSGADLGAFDAASFDLVFSYSVLPHLPPDVVHAYFLEVGRVLRPGGWFRYQFWVGPERLLADNDTLNIRVYAPERFRALHADAGLEVREIEPIDYFDPVLKLSPVWVNAQKVGEPGAAATLQAEREATLSEDELALEYGLLLYLAVKHGERGEAEDAQRVLEEAVRLAPQRVEAYVQWAAHRLEADDVSGALKLFEALTEAAPDEPVGWLYLARASDAADRPERARRALAKFDALAPADPELQAERADIESRLGGGPRKLVRRKRLKKK